MKHPFLRRIGTVLLILSTLVFSVFMTILTAYGWILHGDSYGSAVALCGKAMMLLSVGMLAATVLYLCKKDFLSVIIGAVSYISVFCIALFVIRTADQNGWSGQNAANFGRRASAVWRNGLLGNCLPCLLLMLLALTRFCSYEETLRRTVRKKQRLAEKDRPAPSILGSPVPPPSENHTFLDK